ncbi:MULTISPECIES: peptidylprolyl isomerase [Spirulina sp. CCY15215]|uniref:peptidylprolyl isomerase n=1 Tax=Spirulina sp. CCY15215 TaxID=2767591 RepID=UPI0019508E44|nr:peptidylprolyl isomerase [Spirulina major]
MTSNAFLTIDEQSISLDQTLGYLQAAGKLQSFIVEILRQYILEKTLKEEELPDSTAIVEQAVINFRLQNQLSEPKTFNEWLIRNNLTYERFHGQVAGGVQLAQLKVKIAEPKLQEHFIDRKLALDRIVLSRIIVDNRELAEELHLQILEGTPFERLAKKHSLGEDRIVNGMLGPVSRATLPDRLRAAIDDGNPGDIVGPLQLEERWLIFRIEQFLPASLEDNQIKETLQNEIFEQWLDEKVRGLKVKIEAE